MKHKKNLLYLLVLVIGVMLSASGVFTSVAQGVVNDTAMYLPLVLSNYPLPPQPSPTPTRRATPTPTRRVSPTVTGSVAPPTPPTDAFDWPMAGANHLRTSWTSEEVDGELKPEWYHHFDAYVSQKVQIVAAAGFLYISASDGLHALHAANGGEVWFYPTDLPLGHSPTYADGVVYVGGLDRKIHAINAQTGAGIWTYTAGAGFHTNPLVVDGRLYAGNRDGYFYALYTSGAQRGQLAWRYKTGGPVLYSAAYADGTVYFASNDMYAYALNAQNGNLVWKSAKLGGYGFHSFWPVIYGNYVVFSGTWNYRFVEPGPSGNHNELEREDVYPDNAQPGDPIGPYGHEPGNWAAGTTTIRANAIIQYFEEKPHRRTYFMLQRSNGHEYTFDSDGDGSPEYAPILYFGAKNGTRYPPAVGRDGVIYQANNYLYEDWIARGQVTGWKLGTPYISIPSPDTNAVDEPLGYSIGGDIVYTRLCCDREAKFFNLTTGEGHYLFDQGGNPLRRTLPDLFEQGWDFAYWKHGDPSAPVPYNGRVYTINNNAVVAYSTAGSDPVIPPNEDLGSERGEPASNVERNTIAIGLNMKATANNNTWPLLIYQERYYEISPSDSVRATYTRLFEVAGATSGSPGSLSATNTNITTNWVSTYSGGQTLRTWVSKRAPAILFENTSQTYQLRGNIIGLAYHTSSGVQVASNNVTIPGNSLTESWLLVWDDTAEHRWRPVVISLQNRPTQIVATPTNLTLTYSGAAGYLAITPLYGMSAPLSSEESAWPGGIPAATIERVRLLNRVARYYPSSSTDAIAVNSSNGDVTLTYTYQYLEFTDTWNTNRVRLAYLPPTLALAAWNTSPIRINNQPLSAHTDLGYVTPLGRVAGVNNSASATVRLPGLATYWRTYQEPTVTVNASDPLRARLIAEIDAIIAAGHLRPAYGAHGIWDSSARTLLGHDLADYYHNPAETFYTLLRALPLLPADRQNALKTYLQNEFQHYSPATVSHVGWASGAARDFFNLPPEVQSALPGSEACGVCSSWGVPGENFYASWLYAREFGGAATTLNQIDDFLDDLPTLRQSFSNRLNSRLIGYLGYWRLADLADATPVSGSENTLVELFITRAALSKYPDALTQTGFEYGGYAWAVRSATPYQPDTLFTVRMIGTLWNQMPLYGFRKNPLTGLYGGQTGGGYSFGIDFFSMTPELAAFLDDYARQEVQDAVSDYDRRAPYWFVVHAEELGGEGVNVPIYDVVAMFQAKALILQENRAALEQYLDVPFTPVGDLYYIQNLIATLRAAP